MLLGLLLGAALWWVLARNFSDSAATFALALFCFSPNLIAHFSLATTDGIGTLSLFLGIVAFGVWVNTPNWRNALLLAGAVGFMCVSKFSGVPIAALILVLMSVEAIRRRQKLLAKQLVAVCALSWL